MTFKPSVFQQGIFDWIKSGTGDAVVEARAGSGKTETLVRSMGLINDEKVIFLAFNKSIAEELTARAPAYADVRTLNSLGHRAWLSYWGRVTLNSDKTRSMIEGNLSEFVQRRYGAAIRRLVSIAKSQGMTPGVERATGILANTDQAWSDLIEHYEIDLGNNATDGDELTVINHAKYILQISCEQCNVIDYDDQVYFPVIFGVSPPRYDWVFVDEAQDLSPVQQRLVESARAKGGRIVMCGDNFQSIYGWRGADTESMTNFRIRLNATTLPLSICYRCPKSHIALAQALVPDIQAADNAPDGEITYLGHRWDASMFTNADLIICRNSAPLVRCAYKILSQKVAVRILGCDLGIGLISLIKKLKFQSTEELVESLERWRNKQIDRLLKKNPDATTESIDDKYETIMTFIDMFPGEGLDTDQLCREIENIYSDNTRGVLTLATVHKSKGLESNRVFILNKGLMPARQAKKPWQVQAERNIEYVALTRSRHTLGFIEIEMEKVKR